MGEGEGEEQGNIKLVREALSRSQLGDIFSQRSHTSAPHCDPSRKKLLFCSPKSARFPSLWCVGGVGSHWGEGKWLLKFLFIQAR